jgi:hypothetical protein
MDCASSGNIIDILHSTLNQLEDTPDLRNNDPAVVALKRDVVLTIAELEITKALRQLQEMDSHQRQSENDVDDDHHARAA